MKKWKPTRTEFYETAVSMGFYGREESGLIGKKDNVRKFWEDVFVKIVCRSYIEDTIAPQKKLRILDLGSGTGEGFELITHISPSNPRESINDDFILHSDDIELYFGVDISPAMLQQGRANYRGFKNVRFEFANLEDGLPDEALREEPFNLYLSTYGSLSHLNPAHLEALLIQILEHSANGSVIIFDVHGKFCPAWPRYWNEKKEMLPYTMAYLMPTDRLSKEKIEWFDLCYWSPSCLKERLGKASSKAGVELTNLLLLDRSIFVGRHMDSGLLSGKPVSLRYQVNRLLDHGYRGETAHLPVDIVHLDEFRNVNPAAWQRLIDYQRRWNKIIYLLEALMNHKDVKIKKFIESSETEELGDDLKFLTWLFRNSDRFPVVDFWASVIGPQVAVMLRNIEASYPEGEGCGHGLICGFEVKK